MWIVLIFVHFEKYDFLRASCDKKLIEHKIHISKTHIGATCFLDFKLLFTVRNWNIIELSLSIESINLFIIFIVEAFVWEVLL